MQRVVQHSIMRGNFVRFVMGKPYTGENPPEIT